MQSLILGGVLTAAALASMASTVADRAPQQGVTTYAVAPWLVGRCYRVFPKDGDQLHIFKVLASPAGAWVRVQSDPSAPRVPGARPEAPLWLNAATVFAVQEWTCSD